MAEKWRNGEAGVKPNCCASRAPGNGAPPVRA